MFLSVNAPPASRHCAVKISRRCGALAGNADPYICSSSLLLYFARISWILSVGVDTFAMEESWFIKSIMEARNLLISASI